MNMYLVTWQIDIEAATHREAADKALAVHRNPESVATVFDVAEHKGEALTVDLTERTVRPVALTPNARRFREAAKAYLDAIRIAGRVGKERESESAYRMWDLISHARFMDEPLPGVTIQQPGASTWTGTAYRALQRIASGR